MTNATSKLLSDSPGADASHESQHAVELDRRWPAPQRSFSGAELRYLRMPVGGIGTGCIGFGGRGQLVDWEIFNDPAAGYTPNNAFFVVRTEDGHRVEVRVLEGALTDVERIGPHGSAVRNAGLPRFRRASFAAAYPFGAVDLSDPTMPVSARLEVFNPLIPGDADASGYPLLHYRARLINITDRTVRVSVCGSLPNVVGQPGNAQTPGATFRIVDIPGGTILLGEAPPSEVLPKGHPAMGTVALATVDAPADSVRTGWAALSWGDALGEFWRDFASTGRLQQPSGPLEAIASLTREWTLSPGEEAVAEYVIAWHFPNRLGWGNECPDGERPLIGNHYAKRFPDAGAVVQDYAPRRARLAERSHAFVDSVIRDVPTEIAEAALSALAVLKSPTCFRDQSGRFLAWEGCNLTSGSCHGSCNHVWNYTYPIEDLFPELAWTMREIEFGPAMSSDGRMSFRVGLPLNKYGNHWPVAAADGQFGTVVRLLRTVRSTGDVDRLARIWPAVRKAVEFCWRPGGWDGDADGVMEGCQHNTMDVEWYGPSGTIQSWYLAGLAAAAELVSLLGSRASAEDQAFAERCRDIRDSGAAWTDSELFAGEYYPQHIRPVESPDDIADGLRHPQVGRHDDDEDLRRPVLQIGPGCMADQLVGDSMALLAGVDTGLDAEHRRTAWRSVVRYNTRAGFGDELNTRRTYAVRDERGLLVCSYPDGGMPERPFPYHAEVWSGLEYATATGLILTGGDADALEIVRAVRSRYDGTRRNPFDEVECGAHYARSLASWGMIEAWRHIHLQRP